MGDNSPEKLSYQSLLKQARQVLGVVAWLQFLSFDFLLFSLCLVYHPFFSPSSSLGSVLSKSPQTATFFRSGLWKKMKFWRLFGPLRFFPPPPLPPPPFPFQPPALVNTLCHLHISLQRCLFIYLFIFSVLKPCWLPGHRLPASWSVFYFLQVLLLTGVAASWLID